MKLLDNSDRESIRENALLGDIMKNVPMQDRWIYKAGTSFPPCERFVYWNVINNVFPVKKETLDRLKI